MAGEENISTEEMLKEVNKAICSVLSGGQSYKLGSRQLTRADLNMLYKMRNELNEQLSSGNSGLLDDTYVAEFDGR